MLLLHQMELELELDTWVTYIKIELNDLIIAYLQEGTEDNVRY